MYGSKRFTATQRDAVLLNALVCKGCKGSALAGLAPVKGSEVSLAEFTGEFSQIGRSWHKKDWK